MALVSQKVQLEPPEVPDIHRFVQEENPRPSEYCLVSESPVYHIHPPHHLVS